MIGDSYSVTRNEFGLVASRHINLVGNPYTGPTEAAIWVAHNNERLSNLVIARPLSNAAHDHAAYMGITGKFGHFGIGDGSPADRASRRGYQWVTIGENIAWGQTSVDEVMTDWMDSPGHRSAILGNYQEMGAAAYKDKNGKMWWVVLFGTR